MVEALLHSHFSRYPDMQIQDVYKLLHQAAMGSEHAVSDPESARNWLKWELVVMREGPQEALIDPISPGGEVVRVHLRPFVAAGHNTDVLLDTFIRTANQIHGNVRLLEGFWQAATTTSKFSAGEMNEFILSMKGKNYPAVHHSAEYEKLYRPAYRVVALIFCQDTWL